MEVDLERTEDRAEISETYLFSWRISLSPVGLVSNDYFKFNSKILELEEELKVVGNNMKVLEISEQEAIQREESYAEQIKECTTRLKEVFLSK